MEKPDRSDDFLRELRDGTIRMTNPLSGLGSWFIPARASRPITNAPERSEQVLDRREVEKRCEFCEANHLRTPPEKEWLVAAGDGFRLVAGVRAPALGESRVAFRRVANLFEVVPYDYWVANHGYRISAPDGARMRAYLSDAAGKAHVDALLALKLARQGRPEEDLARVPVEERALLTEGLFGGSHDLVIAGRHFAERSGAGAAPLGAGDLSQDEHAAYVGFTIRAIQDLQAQNPNVRYVMTFQNWLHAGGASFDHLHKQLVGFDGWGVILEREARLARSRPGIYNEAIIDQASGHGLALAENDHAVLLVDIGHRHPTLGIYSRSATLRPWEQSEEEVRGVSDLLHAAHRARGSEVPSNEDWFYAPRDCDAPIPWRVLVRWRINNPSGFEGGTDLYIHPVSPFAMRDWVRDRLRTLAAGEGLGGFRLLEDGRCAQSPLRSG